jgi:hypothetical protein
MLKTEEDHTMRKAEEDHFMRKSERLMRAVLILASAVLAMVPMVGVAAADDCAALGGTIFAGPPPECRISATFTGSGVFNLDETLHILPGGGIRVLPQSSGLTLNICVPPATPGPLCNFRMDNNTLINGDTTINPGHGADIVVNVSNDIVLNTGSTIRSNMLGVSCVGNSRGGNISLNADADKDFAGKVTQQAGSSVLSLASCGKGEIIITGKDVSLDGDVRSEGVDTSIARGGPITINAACNLAVSDTGHIISRGTDPGADLVHLQAGCDVTIFGLVASVGPGHFTITPANRCDGSFRNTKPTNSTACVEIWSGGTLLIDRTGGHRGEVTSDTGQSGGVEGDSWIEIFARDNITILGNGSPCFDFGFSNAPPAANCFAVHANQQGLGNGHGGLIRVTSTKGSVIASGRAIQSNSTGAGGSGGRPSTGCAGPQPCGGIIIEGDIDVDLTGVLVEAKGSTGGFAPHGGQVEVQAFNGEIIATAAPLSKIDVTGDTADGVVILRNCTGVDFPPGVVVPAGVVPSNPVSCGTHPVLPAYTSSGVFPLGPFPICSPACGGVGCPCVRVFRFVAGAPPKVILSGEELKSVTEVQLSLGTCEPGGVGNITVPIVLPKTDPTLTVDVSGIVTGDYKVITISPTGSCCSAATVHIP